MSPLVVGSIVIAPTGLGPLSAGIPYHFLRRCLTRARVLLVRLGETSHACAHLIVLSKNEFERGLALPAPYGLQCHLPTDARPPWLRRTDSESRAPVTAGLRFDYIGNRCAFIEAALAEEEDVLEAYSPIAKLNSLARSCIPRQNETRFRTWFLTFLLYGRAGLAPTFPNCGRWPRRDASDSRKRGRPSKSAGPGAGYNVSPQMARRIGLAFEEHACLGDSWLKIYEKVLRNEFGVRGPIGTSGTLLCHHPTGDPFPSIDQFKYWANKELGREAVQMARFGETRARHRGRAPRDSFTSELMNVMQRCEEDGFYTEEHPTSLVTGEPLERLCVVRVIDVLTGQFIGIGFSVGKETSAAYRMALLCASMDKVHFCSFFGIAIEPHQWPCLGVPHQSITDRGVGSVGRESDVSAIRGITPSHQPRAKACIESSNPKSKTIEGTPHFVQSPLSPIDMIRREIRKLLAHNESADVSSKATTEIRSTGVPLTPNGLWGFYSSRGRTSAHLVPLEVAVRTYGIPGRGTLKKQGVEVHHQTYTHESLHASGDLDRVARSGQVPVNVYLLPFALCVIWVEIKGGLQMLLHKEASLGATSIAQLSEAELEQLNDIQSREDSLSHLRRTAVSLHHADKFEEETAQAWDSKRIVPGRCKVGRTGKAEAAAVRALYGKKSA